MTTPDRTTTFRRRSGAVALAAAPVLFAAAELLYPTDGNDPAHELGTDAAHHGQLLIAIGCTLVASILFFPAFVALMNPVRGRATTGQGTIGAGSTEPGTTATTGPGTTGPGTTGSARNRRCLSCGRSPASSTTARTAASTTRRSA